MISGLAHAAQALQDPSIHKLAEKAAMFIKANMYNEKSATLIRSYREGASNIEGFLDDYSFLIQGLLDLYESDPNDKWISWAAELQKKQDDVFYDKKNHGYFGVAETDDSILIRMKDGKLLKNQCTINVWIIDYLLSTSESDGAEPSGYVCYHC